MSVRSTSSVNNSQSSRAWFWLMAFAVLLIVLGVVAMGSLFFAATVYVIVSGWMLFLGGVLQICGALLFRSGSFRANLFFGLLIIAIGLALIWAPVVVGSLFALLIVIALIADAILEGISAVVTRTPGWIWTLVIALFSLIIGVVIIANPSLLLSLLGLMVGISLVMRGVILLLVAGGARSASQNHA